jgi:hypothetical protein
MAEFYDVEFEFDWQGRTYRVAHSLSKQYTIHSIGNLREKIVIATDTITGDKIFVDWSSIAVLRILGMP